MDHMQGQSCHGKWTDIDQLGRQMSLSVGHRHDIFPLRRAFLLASAHGRSVARPFDEDGRRSCEGRHGEVRLEADFQHDGWLLSPVPRCQSGLSAIQDHLKAAIKFRSFETAKTTSDELKS